MSNHKKGKKDKKEKKEKKEKCCDKRDKSCKCIKASHNLATLYFDSFVNCDLDVPEDKVEKVMVNQFGPLVHVNIYEDRGDFYTTGTPATFNFSLPVQSKVPQQSAGIVVFSSAGDGVGPDNSGTSSGDVAIKVKTYTDGTISQSGNVVTGIGTNFLPSMIGGKIKYLNCTCVTVVGYNSPTSLVVDKIKTVSNQQYKLNYSFGRVYLIGPPIEASEADFSQLTIDFTYLTETD